MLYLKKVAPASDRAVKNRVKGKMDLTKRIPWNNDWAFTENFDGAFLNGTGESTVVRLPHTCKMLPLHYADEHDYQMVCGYRRTFDVPEQWQGKRLFLTLEGAAHQATVYVNGREAASHSCGYTAFTVELTDLVAYGQENTVAVKLDTRESLDQPPFGHVIDYMTFGGLYREAYLEVRSPPSCPMCLSAPLSWTRRWWI